jgi:hypothetical protein
MKKILTHFSPDPFVFNPKFFYKTHPNYLINGFKPKPIGLWLSDETDMGWKEWCEGEEFRLEWLKHRTDFEVDLTRICVLDSDDKIKAFSKEYSVRPIPDLTALLVIDWDRVAKLYSGILISPYSYELRLKLEFSWYYGWDCASACIWDLSAVKPLVNELTPNLNVCI